MSKVYYKIVQRSGNKLISFNIEKENHNDFCLFNVEYKVNEWVYPYREMLDRGFGLCVFDTEDRAETFLTLSVIHRSKFFIYTCEIGKKMEQPSFLSYTNFVNVEKLDSVLNKYECESPKSISSSLWPAGTIVTNKVKLIEEVENGI